MTQDRMNKKQASILEAARDLIAENGFHASPAAQIAEKAGVGVGTMYRYFENKDALVYEVHKEIEFRLHSQVFQDDDSLPVRERFIRIYTRLFNYLIQHPNDYKFLEQFYNSPYGIKKRREEPLGNTKYDLLKKLFVYAKSQQIIKDIHEDILFGLCFGPISFLLKDHLRGFFDLNEDSIQMIVEALWDAIKR
jgi:AcrR family transcriptional regulator